MGNWSGIVHLRSISWDKETNGCMVGLEWQSASCGFDCLSGYESKMRVWNGKVQVVGSILRLGWHSAKCGFGFLWCYESMSEDLEWHSACCGFDFLLGT